MAALFGLSVATWYAAWYAFLGPVDLGRLFVVKGFRSTPNALVLGLILALCNGLDSVCASQVLLGHQWLLVDCTVWLV